MERSIWSDLSKILSTEAAKEFFGDIELHTQFGPMDVRGVFQDYQRPSEGRDQYRFLFEGIDPQQMHVLLMYLQVSDGRIVHVTSDQRKMRDAEGWFVDYRIRLSRDGTDTVAVLTFTYSEVES